MTSPQTKKVLVDHLCRVEGYGGITVRLDGDKIADVEVNLKEGPRFIEAILKGRRYDEIPQLSMRICAICSGVHNITSLLAVEDALGVKVSRQTKLLRELLVQGGNIESHALHIFCLAAPDFLGYPSAVALAADQPELVRLGLDLKKTGNEIQETVGGRAIHPVTTLPGGFSAVPSKEQLLHLKGRLQVGLEQSLGTVDVLAGLTVPDFCNSSAVYAALGSDDAFLPLIGDRIILSDGAVLDKSRYREVTNEFTVEHSYAKQSLYHDKPFMVGALARVLLNGDKLGGEAAKARDKLGLQASPDNILFNNHAQALELVYSVERSLTIIDELLQHGPVLEPPVTVTPLAGTGYGAAEAPRGTLYHSYTFDDDGRLTDADIVTPTAQNQVNIEKDLRISAENLAGVSEEDLRKKLEMVVRSYDPCISCAVHLVRIERE